MPKGFNPTEDLGYVIIVIPEFNAYAAKRTKDSDGETFIGIASSLELAHFWKRAKAAQNAVLDYMEVIQDEIDRKGEAIVLINHVTRDKDGQFRETNDRKLTFSAQ